MWNEKIYFSTPKVPIYIGRTDYETKCGLIFSTHFHKEIEILYIVSGSTTAFVNGKEYVVNEGSVLFLNSRVPHSTVTTKKNTRNILLQFPVHSNEYKYSSIKYLERFMQTNKTMAFVFEPKHRQTEELISYIDNLVREYTKKEKAYEYYMLSNLQSIIALLHRNDLLIDNNTLFDSDTIKKIMPVLQYVTDNYNENISIEELSELLHFSRHYFCRLFKKATNTTFVEYRNFVRICKAENMLRNTDKSISDIACDLGFASLSYFVRTFKKYKLYSPLEYKKLSKVEDSLINWEATI